MTIMSVIGDTSLILLDITIDVLEGSIDILPVIIISVDNSWIEYILLP